MLDKPRIIKLLDTLKSKISAMPLTRKQIAVYITLTAISLGCASSVQMTPDNGAPRATHSSGEWLTQGDYMPTFDFVPPQPNLPEMRTGEKEIYTNTTIEFYVDEQGKVNPVLTNVKEDSGYYTLGRIALQWAKKITFHPGIHQGKPVKVILCRQFQWMVR